MYGPSIFWMMLKGVMMAYFSFILTLPWNTSAAVYRYDRHATYSAFPSSKSIVLFCNFHVDSMFRT